MSSKGKVIKRGGEVVFDMPLLKKKDAAEKERKEEHGARHSQEPKADEIKRQAYERGFAAGEKDGMDAGLHRAAGLLEGLDSIVRDINDLRSRIIGEAEPQLVGLAAAIARRIVIRELEAEPELIVEMVKKAVGKMERSGRITIRMNPDLYDLLVARKPELVSLHPEIVYEVDPAVPAAGPVVIGEKEEILTGIDAQLDSILEYIKCKHDGHRP